MVPIELDHGRPPLDTVLVEIVGWTLDRTAGFPKSQRFTFGQRLDNLTLDAAARRSVDRGGSDVRPERVVEALVPSA